jgi:hypothetical protein
MSYDSGDLWCWFLVRVRAVVIMNILFGANSEKNVMTPLSDDDDAAEREIRLNSMSTIIFTDRWRLPHKDFLLKIPTRKEATPKNVCQRPLSPFNHFIIFLIMRQTRW